MRHRETLQAPQSNETGNYTPEALIIEIETLEIGSKNDAGELEALQKEIAEWEAKLQKEEGAGEAKKEKEKTQEEEPVFDRIGEIHFDDAGDETANQPTDLFGPEGAQRELLAQRGEVIESKQGMSRREAIKKLATYGAGVLATGAAGTLLYEAAKPSKPKKVETKAPAPTTVPEKSEATKPAAVADTAHEAVETAPKKPVKNLEDQDTKDFGRLAEKMDMHFYKEMLRDDGRLVYLERITDAKEMKEHPGYWIMVDKKTATMYLINENKLVRSGQILLGREPGDQPNDQDKESGHQTTPPAYTVLSNDNIAAIYRKKYGNNLWRIEGTSAYPEEEIFMHGLLGKPGEKEALASAKATDHRQSDGCVRNPNIVEDQKHFVSNQTRIAILAEKQGSWLNIQTKKIESSGDSVLKAQLKTIIDKNK